MTASKGVAVNDAMSRRVLLTMSSNQGQFRCPDHQRCGPRGINAAHSSTVVLSGSKFSAIQVAEDAVQRERDSISDRYDRVGAIRRYVLGILANQTNS
jgi:hypothetical protein